MQGSKVYILLFIFCQRKTHPTDCVFHTYFHRRQPSGTHTLSVGFFWLPRRLPQPLISAESLASINSSFSLWAPYRMDPSCTIRRSPSCGLSSYHMSFGTDPLCYTNTVRRLSHGLPVLSDDVNPYSLVFSYPRVEQLWIYVEQWPRRRSSGSLAGTHPPPGWISCDHDLDGRSRSQNWSNSIRKKEKSFSEKR